MTTKIIGLIKSAPAPLGAGALCRLRSPPPRPLRRRRTGVHPHSVERIRRDLRRAYRLSKRPRSPKAAGVPYSYTTAPQPVSRRSCSSASAGMCALSRKGRTYTVSPFTRHTAAHCPPATITGRMMPCKV